MQVLPIQAIPNQDFSIVLSDDRWDISIKAANGSVAVTLVRNNVTVIENLRAVAGERIIPSKYEEAGNFTIVTQNSMLPDYTQFGVTQSLVYLSQDELDVIRIPPAPPITALYFDPIAALPLRFVPQGYTTASIIHHGKATFAPHAVLHGIKGP